MAHHAWFERLSVRSKLLIVSIFSVLVVAGVGGAWMMGTARRILTEQIDDELQRSADLLTSLVQKASDASVRSYLRAVAEKNVEMLASLQARVARGELSLDEAKAQGRDLLLSERIGDTGYIFVVDGAGVVRVHPKSAWQGVDVSRYAFIQRVMRVRSGYHEYDWANPGEEKARPKAAEVAYFEPWDWIVSASSYREEFTKLLNVQDLSDTILSIHFGESGYAYVITEDGTLVIHPKLAGENVYDSVDDQGRYFIREMCERKVGRIRYSWKNPGEGVAREKIVVFRNIPDRKLIVTSSVYVDELQRPLLRLKRSMWGTAVGVVVLLVAVLFLAGTAMTKPLQELMGRIAKMWDDLGLATHASHAAGAAASSTTDEIIRLTARFDDMAIAIRQRDRQLGEHRHNLEALVARRTRELSTRNDEMQLVLDTIDQGLAIVDLDGRLGMEQSARFRHWFGASDGGAHARFFDLFVPPGSAIAEYFGLGWEALVEGVMPIDVCIDQLPKRFERDGRHYDIAYRPILDHESKLSKVLLIISDVSSEAEQLVHEAERKESLDVFERVMKDRSGFIEFFNEASRVTEELADSPPDDGALSRSVHTLKGNAGIFGVKSIAEICQALEVRAAEAGASAMREALPLLIGRWTAFAHKVLPLIGTSSDDIVEVRRQELDRISHFVRQGATTAKLLDAIERLKAESVEVRFGRIAEQARGIAQRLGKGDVKVVIRAGDLRLPTERWGEFWAAFVHAVRNAVDHGLEAPDHRIKTGKPVPGQLVLSAEEQEGFFVITLRDDGKGVDWSAVRERATALQLPAVTETDLKEALFADGLSTKTEVTELSGRGVGMGAIREATTKLGGAVLIDSVSGKGTALRFVIPADGNRLAPAGVRFSGVGPTPSADHPRMA